MKNKIGNTKDTSQVFVLLEVL